MNSQLLPDVNVWVALHHRVHEHHDLAMRWFESLPPETVLVFCRQTQMGLFRLLTTEAVMGDEVLTQHQCWSIYFKWTGEGKARFAGEPSATGEAFAQRTAANSPSPKTWSGDYLAAFSESGRLTLVTFDRALASKVKGSLVLA